MLEVDWNRRGISDIVVGKDCVRDTDTNVSCPGLLRGIADIGVEIEGG
jgi:hypothetical protein